MATIDQIRNSIESALDGESPLEDIEMLFIVERWDARHIGQDVVRIDWFDRTDIDRWCDINFKRYPVLLGRAIDEMKEVFPGIQLPDIIWFLTKHY